MLHVLMQVSEEESSTFLVTPGIGLMLWMFFLFFSAVTLVAMLTSALTRQWDIVLIGLITFGLAWYLGLYRALRGRQRPVRWVRDPAPEPPASA